MNLTLQNGLCFDIVSGHLFGTIFERYARMRRSPRLFRLVASAALSALLGDAMLPLAALAQAALPPLPPGEPGQPPDQNQGDPPERVGRIATVNGPVSFRTQGDTDWTPASINYPVSAGNSFWTEPTATADLEVSDSRVALAGATELTVTGLDMGGLQAVAAQGEAYLRLRDLAPNEKWLITTPRGVVRLRGAGRYDIIVGTTDQPTLVTVMNGAALIEGPGVSLTVAENQTATLTGTDPFQGSIGPAVRTDFLNAQMETQGSPPPPAVPIPQQVMAMPGGEDLAAAGTWSDVPDYGPVWYPPVSAGWVPYREGRWAYVAPWGWTWIDNAPWGFAPFHYGRWMAVRGRWGWTPGIGQFAAPPVYAPALVTFLGAGAGIGLGAALASGSVGWVPLGPREPYHPWYHASPRYVRRVNIGHTTNINDVTINNFVNRNAATAIPASAMTQSHAVQTVARPITTRELSAARPIIGRQPIRPASTTIGITPAVARQLHLGPVPTQRTAPGPAVHGRADVSGPSQAQPQLGTESAEQHGERTLSGPAGQPGLLGTPFMPGERVHPPIAPAWNRSGTPLAPPEPGRPGTPASPPAAPAYGQPEYAQPEYGQPGYAPPGYAPPGYAPRGYAPPGDQFRPTLNNTPLPPVFGPGNSRAGMPRPLPNRPGLPAVIEPRPTAGMVPPVRFPQPDGRPGPMPLPNVVHPTPPSQPRPQPVPPPQPVPGTARQPRPMSPPSVTPHAAPGHPAPAREQPRPNER